MKIKRYIVKDMSEAMVLIKGDLGKDAVILHSRPVKPPGIFGWFKKHVFEVVAAVDEAVEPRVSRNAGASPYTSAPTSNMQENEADAPGLERVSAEIEALKAMMTALLRNQAESTAMREAPVATSALAVPKVDAVKTEESSENACDILMAKLLSHDVQEVYAQELIAALPETVRDSLESAKSALQEILEQKMGFALPVERSENPVRLIFFAGPTGVGKTTTLAKLAARLSLVENKRIGLITADTFRIAAVDQLNTYSEILGVPLKVVYDAEEFQAALKQFSYCDYILIDTAGKNHKSAEMAEDLKELLSVAEEYELYLLLCATTSFTELKKIIDSYSFVQHYKVLITKVDEASVLGNIINIRMLTRQPLTYFAIGQSVPDDIEVADCSRIIQSILEEV